MLTEKPWQLASWRDTRDLVTEDDLEQRTMRVFRSER